MMTNKKKMYTNKLAEVHVNSIPNEAIRTISSQFNFFFFCEKISGVQKRKSTKTNQRKLKKANEKQKKKTVFLRTKTSKKVEIICFGFWCFLYTQNFFVKINK